MASNSNTWNSFANDGVISVSDTNKLEYNSGKVRLKEQSYSKTDNDNTTSGEFKDGTKANVDWDTDHLKLSSGQLTGSYTSPVFDSGQNTNFSDLNFTGQNFYTKNPTVSDSSPINLAGSDFDSTLVTDINGDGRDDILTYFSGNGIGIYYQNESGGYDFFNLVNSLTSPWTYPLPKGGQQLAVGDFNNDQKKDIVLFQDNAIYESIYMDVMINNGGTIPSFTELELKNFGNEDSSDLASGLLASDLNGDGLDDIVYVNWFSDTIKWLKNTTSQGTVSFAPEATLFNIPSGFLSFVRMIDLNNDNKKDIFFRETNYSNNANKIVWLRNNGQANPTFTRVEAFNLPPYDLSNYDYLDTGDLNGDGKYDIMLSSQARDWPNKASILTYINNGDDNTPLGHNLTFTSHTIENNLDSNRHVKIADLNKDGKNDLVMINGADLRIWYNTNNNGVDYLASQKTLSAGNYCDAQFLVGDVDNDGFLDLILLQDKSPYILYKVNIDPQQTALALNYRACDDAACSGESWSEALSTANNSIATSGKYFQYKANFSTNEATTTPYLLSVAINGKYYPADSPYAELSSIYNPNPNYGWKTFSASFAPSDKVKFQLYNGTSWQYYSGSWQNTTNTTDVSLAHSNTKEEINSAISSFPYSNGLKWRAIFNSTGLEQTELTSVGLTYKNDNTKPNAPSLSSISVNGTDWMGTSGNWHSANVPATGSLTFSASDNPGGSGVAGYYLSVTIGQNDCTSTKPTDIPIQKNLLSEHGSKGANYYYTTTPTIDFASVDFSSLLTPGKKCLWIQAADADDNYSNVSSESFYFKIDNTLPANPSNITVSPSTWSATNSFTFTWPAGSDDASGIKKYWYQVQKADTTVTDWIETTDLKVEFSEATEGVNIFRLKCEDNADNMTTFMPVNFYYNESAPSSIGEITVNPASAKNPSTPATVNYFSFSWDPPAHYNGQITKYYYAFRDPNKLDKSELGSAPWTTTNSLPEGSWAYQQGPNTIYIVAEDNTGHVNPDVKKSLTFYAQTPAPEAVTGVNTFDISNKDARDWSVLVKWNPLSQEEAGAGFEGYSVFRCVNNLDHSGCKTETDYDRIADLTGTGTTYVDSGLVSDINQPYSYIIKARDNAQQYSAINPSEILNATEKAIVPTGTYTKPPKINGKVTVSAKSYSATVSWDTVDDPNEDQKVDVNHVAQGFVLLSPDKNSLDNNKASILAEHESSNKHALSITDLQPETTYWYQIIWKDNDGNEGKAAPEQFTTAKKPEISNVQVNNIQLHSATIAWGSTNISNSKISYCVKDSNQCNEVREMSANSEGVHMVQLDNLSHSTIYHYEIIGTSEEGKIVKSDGYDFSTLIMPEISGNVSVDQDKEAPTTTYRFSWKTNIPTSSIVYYQTNEGSKQSKSSPELTIDHEIAVANLFDKSTYNFDVTGVDSHGINIDKPFSATLTTPQDSRPPKVSNLTIEVKSSGYGAAQKAQVVVTWETDEPSTSQVEYEQGISGNDYQNLSKQDEALSTSHVVILGELVPSKIYHLRAISRDGAGNIGRSGDTTTITGKTQNSVLDIIMSSLQRSLGWIIGGFKFKN